MTLFTKCADAMRDPENFTLPDFFPENLKDEYLYRLRLETETDVVRDVRRTLQTHASKLILVCSGDCKTLPVTPATFHRVTEILWDVGDDPDGQLIRDLADFDRFCFFDLIPDKPSVVFLPNCMTETMGFDLSAAMIEHCFSATDNWGEFHEYPRPTVRRLRAYFERLRRRYVSSRLFCFRLQLLGFNLWDPSALELAWKPELAEKFLFDISM